MVWLSLIVDDGAYRNYFHIERNFKLYIYEKHCADELFDVFILIIGLLWVNY